MRYKSSLRNSVLAMTVLPVLLMGIIVTFVVTFCFRRAMYAEVEKELYNVAVSLSNTLDTSFPGDYVTYGDSVLTLVKGESIINDRFELIDPIKEDTGLELTVFYNNIRFLTTIRDNDGERILGTYCSSLISDAVLKSGTDSFFPSVEIGDGIYFAYYKPLINSDNSCVGMICVAKNVKDVNRLIKGSVYPVIIITLLMMTLVIIVSVNYSKNFIKDLTKLKEFMKKVEGGNFNANFDYDVMKRNDEITDMCESAVHMQKVLGALIEHDALTGLYNRRSAGRFLLEMHKSFRADGEQFAVVLGDIDFFKKVNDTYGHDAGDEVLKYVSRVLMIHMKGRGFASRWGGEEFLLGFKNADGLAAAETAMEILGDIREHEIDYNGNRIKITMSFGVAQSREDCSTVDAIAKDADERLYIAKEHGRNQVVIDDDGNIYEQSVHGEDEADAKDLAEDRRAQLFDVDEELLEYIRQLNELKDEDFDKTDDPN